MSLRRLLAPSVILAISVLLPIAPAGRATTPGPASRIVPFGCNREMPPGQARCLGLARLPAPGQRPHAGFALNSTPVGLGPSQIESAYQLANLSVRPGTTVGIVDAYDDPKVDADLAVYRNQFSLPPCTKANGCFVELNQAGRPGPLPGANEGWAEEISLDVDAVSATCPTCRILLVEATTQAAADFDVAVDTAVSHGATAVSNSYSFAEQSGQVTDDDPHYHHPGVPITASSGDSGYGVGFPSTSPFVTAVGGTTLTAANNPRGFTESAWSGSGSGCSAYEPKPAWQHDTGCPRRMVADVSADADPNSGLAVYDSYITPNVLPPYTIGIPNTGGWMQVGGTSLSSPIVATVFAMAGDKAGPASPYGRVSHLFDVVSGSNCTGGGLGGCPGTYQDTAQPGYDGPTGLGTPKGTAAF